MSALRAPAAVPGSRPAPSRRTRLTAVQGGRAEGGRRLSAVRAPLQARTSGPFLAVCAAILGCALLAVLLINTNMAYNSYEMARLQNTSARLAQDVQVTQEKISGAEASLQQRATALGMVPADAAALLDVSAAAAALVPPKAAGAGQ